MKRFARLFQAIDETTRTTAKVDAMVSYFAAAAPADAAWAVWFLSGNRPRRLLPVRRLSAWAMAEADVKEWLFDECYDAVGDLAETISLLLPDGAGDDTRPLHEWVEHTLLPIASLPEERQRGAVLAAWRSLRGVDRFVWNKLITGAFRVGVSKQLVVRALSRVSGIDEGTIAHRLSGNWRPTADSFVALMASDTSDADRSRPYPFYLAYPLEQELDELGAPSEWQLEWKWDGIRAQLVRRDGRTYLWSRGEELVTDRFPEIAEAARLLPKMARSFPGRTGSRSPSRRCSAVSVGPDSVPGSSPTSPPCWWRTMYWRVTGGTCGPFLYLRGARCSRRFSEPRQKPPSWSSSRRPRRGSSRRPPYRPRRGKTLAWRTHGLATRAWKG